jgi:CRP/FNR family transcriptional regulator, cyclic AMP receptor protein
MTEESARIRVLEADRKLAASLDADAAAEATRRLVTPVATVAQGSWDPSTTIPDPSGHLGLLVLDGLMTRGVQIEETSCAELVGPGDVLRPWEQLWLGAPIPYEVRWRALEPARLAVLNREFTGLTCRWPELVTALMSRAVVRAHALALSMAIGHMTKVQARLLALFWHLADRWGKVRPEGVVVPIRLTHEVIATLVGAQRPSVSTALKQLEREGLIVRAPDAWVLHGDPPEELHRLYVRAERQGAAG